MSCFQRRELISTNFLLVRAMKNPRLTVFAGAITSLAFMHVMASFFGYATTIIPRIFTFYLSSFLFAVFGIKMIWESYHMSENEGQEEFEEVNEELRKREEKESRGDLESGNYRSEVTAMSLMSKIFIQSFTMTTLAEWGDRSQLATVILAAREDVYGVCVGGILTSGGRRIGGYHSEGYFSSDQDDDQANKRIQHTGRNNIYEI